MKKINKGVGKRIKETRDDWCASQEEFGRRIGVCQRYVGMLEKGQRKPSQGLVIAISAVFKVEADWLRTGRKG